MCYDENKGKLFACIDYLHRPAITRLGEFLRFQSVSADPSLDAVLSKNSADREGCLDPAVRRAAMDARATHRNRRIRARTLPNYHHREPVWRTIAVSPPWVAFRRRPRGLRLRQARNRALAGQAGGSPPPLRGRIFAIR